MKHPSPPTGRIRRLLAALALSATFAATGASAQPAVIDLEDCRLDGVRVPARCGALAVHEDRAAGAGRTIDLKVVVIPAVAEDAEPDPLFFLAGGPGQAATELAGPALRWFGRVRRTRDLVFVDQRGTGGSGELTCAYFEEQAAAQELSGSLQFDPVSLDRLRACLDEIEEHADPRHYTTPVAMDDLDDVRAALGYATINLYGASYGTRAGLVYMRRHRARVRTAVLDGLAPVSLRLPSSVGADAQRALDRLFADCNADAGCRRAYPDLRQTFERIIASLEANPRTLAATHPRTGEPLEFPLTAAGFAGDLRAVLYAPTVASLLPWTLTRAADGDFAPYLAQSVRLSDIGELLSPAMHLSVVCAEDVSQIAPGAAAGPAGESLLGRESFQALLDACAVWPAAELPSRYFEPVQSDVPTLLLSGDLDPVTPPRWGEDVLRGLRNARHVVAPGAGHGVVARGCTDDVIAQFVDGADPHELDVSCIEELRRPPFVLSPAGADP